MRARIPGTAIAFFLIVLLVAPAAADDVTGENKLLCAPVQASECGRDGCTAASIWELNLPQFVEIDLKDKSISTTRSSSENRSTKIDSINKNEGLIVLQGFEHGRAYSMVITESTGFATMGITMDDGGVVIFASCTRASS